MTSRKSRRQLRFGIWIMVLVGTGLLTIFGAGVLGPWWNRLGVIMLVLILCHRWMKDEGGIPVLVYHSITFSPKWLPWAREISVSPKTFEAHLQLIQQRGYPVIRTTDLYEARRSGKNDLPDRSVVIHLDDGYLDNWVVVFPLLRRYNFPATLFVSLDFIESGKKIRLTLEDVELGRCRAEDIQWEGYLNWAELRLMQASGLIDIQSHGIDHGRVETSCKMVDTITSENWRHLAWVQWRAMPGDKTSWFHNSHPPYIAYGSPVRENEVALAARAWTPSGIESEQEYSNRVESVLRISRETLERKLNKKVDLFCWPQNQTTDQARCLAEKVGYFATTGGKGENRPDEPFSVISRFSVNEQTLGWRWVWADKLALQANIRLFQGNYYWYPLVFAFNRCRKLVFRLRRNMGTL